MIRVILADDHHLVRQGIRSLLEKVNDVEIIAEAENGQQAVDLTRDLTPDVLVIDINMPRLNGIQAAEQIQTEGSATKIVILSMYSDETLVRQALQSGVRGYILKRSVMEELLLAVRAAYRGELFLSPSVSEFILNDLSASQSPQNGLTGFAHLSAREREILKLIAEGHTNKSIGETMHLSTKTVEKHRASLMTKLDADNLADLIRAALKHGLIFLDE